MPFVAAKASVFKLDNAAGTLTDISAYVDSVGGIANTTDMLETTTFGATSKSYIGGLRNGDTISVSGKWDATLNTQVTALLGATSTSTPAQAVLDALYGAISHIAQVKQCRVFENDQDTTQPVTGLPPHSIYCVVDGGDAPDIAAAIWLRKTAGTTMVGAVSHVINDSQGNPHTIKFSRPTDKNVYVVVNLTTRAGWPTDGADRIKAALVAWSLAEQAIGEELIYSRLFSPINTVPGFAIDSLFIGTSAAPTGTTNIAVAFDEIARLDTARITVNVTPP